MQMGEKWEHVTKDDAASLTMAPESILITAAIKVHEKQYVDMIELSTSYLHVENYEFIMTMEGWLT